MMVRCAWSLTMKMKMASRRSRWKKNYFSCIVDAEHNIGFRTYGHRIRHYIHIAGTQSCILLYRDIHDNALFCILEFRAVIFFFYRNAIGTLVINYEDENGQPAEPVEKELTLLVEEDVQEDWNMDMPEDVDASGQAASEANNKLLLAGGGAVLVAVIAAAVFTVKFIKKRKEAKQQKDDENEIS